MLFVATLKSRGRSSFQEILSRRIDAYDYPEGVRVIGEYWPQGGNANVVTIFEADSIEQIMPITRFWIDDFAINISPAVEAEDAMAAAKERMS